MIPLESSRQEILEGVSEESHTKLLIIGGGIHGAAFARIAALNSTPCILFERGDYASGTSSRSSKMAHGGLRYLENFDFQQVFEGIKAREQLFDAARHLCKAHRFLIPIDHGDWFTRLKLGIGLHLYDRMVTKKERKHFWIPRSELSFEGFHSERSDLMGCYSYCDGIVNDARLTIESILQARAFGARALNYMEVISVTKLKNGTFEVVSRDRILNKEYVVTADLVVNCAGPWAPYIGHTESKTLSRQLRYSAGIHLLFNRPWNQPALFLPMEGKSRYYFVWPHPGGTMVGTTEREVTDIPFEQYPVEAEIEEVMERIRKDLPNTGLTKDSLHYAFAGVRTLALRGKEQGTATLSRKHIWQNQSGVLTLLGGKLTTASWTAFEGYKIACRMVGIKSDLKNGSQVHYPGWGTDTELAAMTQQLLDAGIEPATAHRIIQRLGSRARYLLEKPERLQQITPRLLQGELELSFFEEQAHTIEDILRRRTELEYMIGCGVDELGGVVQFLSSHLSHEEVNLQSKNYLLRISQILKSIDRYDL